MGDEAEYPRTTLTLSDGAFNPRIATLEAEIATLKRDLAEMTEKWKAAGSAAKRHVDGRRELQHQLAEFKQEAAEVVQMAADVQCELPSHYLLRRKAIALLDTLQTKDAPMTDDKGLTLPEGVEIGEFKPCVFINEEAGIIEVAIEDVASISEPLLPSVYHWIDKQVAMDDGRFVGLTIWQTKPAAPVAREGWQPIETAPKDGTPVLISAYGGIICLCKWYDDPKCWAESDDILDEENTDLARLRWAIDEPTHWMPLPPTPTEDQHKGERR